MLRRLHEVFSGMMNHLDNRKEEKYRGVANELVGVRRELERGISEQKRLEAECLKAKNKFDMRFAAELEEALKEQRKRTKELKLRFSTVEAEFQQLETKKLTSIARDKARRIGLYGQRRLKPAWIATVILVSICSALVIWWFLSNYSVTFY
jgi:hypothetical protein